MPRYTCIIFPLLLSLAYLWYQNTETMSSPSSVSSYVEGIIVAQITTIYSLLHKLSYFNRPRDEMFPFNEIAFPPAGGHVIRSGCFTDHSPVLKGSSVVRICHGKVPLQDSRYLNTDIPSTQVRRDDCPKRTEGTTAGEYGVSSP